MTTVAISAQPGALGHIGAMTAQRLGFVLADHRLVAEAAEALGWSEEEVERFDERTGGLGRRLLDRIERLVHILDEDADVVAGEPEISAALAKTFGEAAYPPRLMPADRQYLEVIKRLVQTLANQDHAVIVGRGGQAILSDRADVLKVLLFADREERTRRLVHHEGLQRGAALQQIEQLERERADWHQKYFGIEVDEPRHYDLLLNVGRLGDAFAARFIASAVGDFGASK